MHALHARLPKNFVLEERLERYADAIEIQPARYAGRWAEACHPLAFGAAADAAVPGATAIAAVEPALPRFDEVRLDLGCGKGGFTVEAAAHEKNVLFVGIDFEPICIAYAAQKAVESGLDNVIFVPGTAEDVTTYFSPGELSRIYLNFPTPFPRKKEAALRLTHADNLMRYRGLLAPGGSILLKTDSYPLRGYSRTQFALAGYRTLWESDDARADRPCDPMSWYEERLSKQGACVYAIEATPEGPAPATPIEQGDVSPSLIDYLPDNLEDLAYVPHGMQGTVINLVNQKAKRGEKNRSKPCA